MHHIAISRTGPEKGARSTNRGSASERAAPWTGDGRWTKWTRWDQWQMQKWTRWLFRSFMEAVWSSPLPRFEKVARGQCPPPPKLLPGKLVACKNNHITFKPQRRRMSLFCIFCFTVCSPVDRLDLDILRLCPWFVKALGSDCVGPGGSFHVAMSLFVTSDVICHYRFDLA